MSHDSTALAAINLTSPKGQVTQMSIATGTAPAATPATQEALFTLDETWSAIERAIARMEVEARPTWMLEEALSSIARAVSELELPTHC